MTVLLATKAQYEYNKRQRPQYNGPCLFETSNLFLLELNIIVIIILPVSVSAIAMLKALHH